MYNYHTNQKKKHQSQQLQHQKQTEQKLNQKKTQNDKKLIQRFVERSTHGYQRMLDANQEIKEYREYHHQFREFDKNKNIGPPSFYFQFRNDKERVNQATKQNNNLDQVPFFARQNPTRHKFRETKSKHDFKYTPFNTASRVIEVVQNMNTNQVPTSWDLNVRSLIKSIKRSNCVGSSRHHSTKNEANTNTTQRNAKKIVLPLLNIKHHPKSIDTIKNKIEIGPLKETLMDNNRSHNGLMSGQSNKNIKMEKKGRKPALKIQREKNFKSQTVHMATLSDESML